MVSDENIISRRFSALHLAHRSPAEEAPTVCAPIGLSASHDHQVNVQFASRIIDHQPRVTESLQSAGHLIVIGEANGTARLLRWDDLGLFTRALAPRDAQELDFMVEDWMSLFSVLGSTPYEMLSLMRDVLFEVVGDRRLSTDQLNRALLEAMQLRLSSAKQEVFTWPGLSEPQRTIGEQVVSVMLPIAIRFIPLRLRTDPKGIGFLHEIVSIDSGSDATEEAEVVRRFLRAFAPADIDDFARFACLSHDHAVRLWNHVSMDELIGVLHHQKEGWMLADDHDVVGDFEGLRFLSANDPLLQGRHRDLLIHGKTQHSYFFRNEDPPGMVLADGQCIAGWRMRHNRDAIAFVIEDIGESLGKVALDELEEEAERVATAVGLRCDSVMVTSL